MEIIGFVFFRDFIETLVFYLVEISSKGSRGSKTLVKLNIYLRGRFKEF